MLLVTSGIFAFDAWQTTKLHGTGTLTVTTTPPPTPVVSFDATITSDSVAIGTISGGATLPITGLSSVATHVVGLQLPNASNLADGDYAFTLVTAPDKTVLKAYFAAKSGWTDAMKTQINSEIDGTSTFFTLGVHSGVYTLVDAFKTFLGSTYSPYPVTVDDDYPVGTYTYSGTLSGTGGAANKVFTVTLNVTKTNNFAYTLSSSTLAFNPKSVSVGALVDWSTTLTVTNTGNVTITGFSLANTTGPTGLTLSVDALAVPIAPGTSGTATFHLTGTAPSTPQTISLVAADVLHSLSCDFKPAGP